MFLIISITLVLVRRRLNKEKLLWNTLLYSPSFITMKTTCHCDHSINKGRKSIYVPNPFCLSFDSASRSSLGSLHTNILVSSEDLHNPHIFNAKVVAGLQWRL
jgi:hypothetical protein